MSNTYIVWLVILTPYNLSPWKMMKQPYLITSSFICGPTSLGRDIDVYLLPLVNKLKELGDEAYDVSTNHMFQLHTTLICTINDFLVYGSVFGWTINGFTCHVCLEETPSHQLRENCVTLVIVVSCP